MAISFEFRNYIVELLEPIGQVQARNMFGGAGLYLDGTIFALLFGDTLFFKVDDQNRDDFISEGMQPFNPFDDGNRIIRSYFECPARLLDNEQELCDWARRSWEAGRRIKLAKTNKTNGKT